MGGKPIGWDPSFPSPSLLSVGPLLPGSFHSLPRMGKYRHVALGGKSPGARHRGQHRLPSTCQGPPRHHLHRGASTLPCSARVLPYFAQLPLLGRGSSIPLHRTVSFLVGHVNEAPSPWPAGIEHSGPDIWCSKCTSYRVSPKS